MRAEFTPDNHYAGLLAQAKALFRITQSQEAIISTLRSKLTELESQLAMVGTAEIEAQRAANEQLTNEVERLTAHNANLQTAVDAGLRQSYMLREFASKIGISDREDPLETLIGGWTRAAEAMRDSLNEHNRMWKEVLQTRHEHRQMAAQNKRLINCFTTLMEHSTGVAGLHLNGDVAPWSELTEGGRFEEWLLPLSEPRDQSIDALEAQWQAEAIPGFIREMGERLRTQDNRITADPLFCVFEKDYVVAEEGYGHDRINEESNQGLEKDNYGNTLSWKATPDYGLIEVSLNGEELVSWCYEDEPESVFNEFFTVWKKAQEAAKEQQ
ncbi:hypothetical protein [Thalassolituus sp.]|uniref:hypothetical protein n=1 Tax=Thalassolituus sp. TaxID=2030822 RepID=UPI002602C54F|nr:hypothetical protein [Thalassolituus sp.]